MLSVRSQLSTRSMHLSCEMFRSARPTRVLTLKSLIAPCLDVRISCFQADCTADCTAHCTALCTAQGLAAGLQVYDLATANRTDPTPCKLRVTQVRVMLPEVDRRCCGIAHSLSAIAVANGQTDMCQMHIKQLFCRPSQSRVLAATCNRICKSAVPSLHPSRLPDVFIQYAI